MVRHCNPPSQTWRTFLDTHVKTMVSVDFFTVPTIRFQVLYVFLVLAHDRRRIIRFRPVTRQDEVSENDKCRTERRSPSPSLHIHCTWLYFTDFWSSIRPWIALNAQNSEVAAHCGGWAQITIDTSLHSVRIAKQAAGSYSVMISAGHTTSLRSPAGFVEVTGNQAKSFGSHVIG